MADSSTIGCNFLLSEVYMCNCVGMARTFDDERSKVIPSNHHPKCEDYKLEKFIKISLDGASAIFEENEAAEFTDSEYKKEDIFLTRDQFEKLEEFAGW